MIMTTTYRLSYVYMDYSHEETIKLSIDKDDILEEFHWFIDQTIKSNDADDAIDYVSIQDADDSDIIIAEYAFK